MGKPLPSELLPSDDREVELGMPGSWADDCREPSDHFTTKIGGKPDWPAPVVQRVSELLKCNLCGGHLGLVAQVYSPLTIYGKSLKERTLYVLGCPAPCCGIERTSWRTIRIQKEDDGASDSEYFTQSETSLASEPMASSSGTVPSWVDPSAGRPESSGQRTTEWWLETSWGSSEVEGDAGQADPLSIQELQTSLLEAGLLAANARQSGQPARTTTGWQDSRSSNRDEDLNSAPPVLPCFYVYTQSETTSHHNGCDLEAGFIETPDPAIDSVSALALVNQVGEIWDAEEYEPDRALNADSTYLQFKKKLDCNPEQCYRYCYGGQPLYAVNEEMEAGRCSACGGPRWFEMQLMPPLLYFLQQAHKDLPLQSSASDNWEWLTILVYSCAQSCAQSQPQQSGSVEGTPNWSVIEEFAVPQQESPSDAYNLVQGVGRSESVH